MKFERTRSSVLACGLSRQVRSLQINRKERVARGESRTRTGFLPGDFKSPVSTIPPPELRVRPHLRGLL